MNNEDLLLSEGAIYFGNRLIYKNQDIGITAPGSALVLFPEADPILANLRNITDVEVKPTKASKASKKADVPTETDIEKATAAPVDDIFG